MVKINLLDIPDDQQSSSKPQQTPPDPSNSGGVIDDFSFFPTEEENQETTETMTETQDLQPSYFEQVDDTAEQPNPFSGGEEYKSEYSSGPPSSFDSGPSKSRLFILGGVVLLTIIALLAYLYFSTQQDDTPEFITANPNLEQTDLTANGQPSNTQQPQNVIPASLQSRYSNNQAQNDLHLNYADNILNTSTPGTGYSLAVFTSGYIYLSVLGDSRDAIAEYRKVMKNSNPRLNLTVESIEDKFVGGEKKLLADFSILTNDASGQGGRSGQFGNIISVQQAQSAVRSTAQKHQLRTIYFKAGNQSTEGSLRKTYLYTRVSGSKTSVIQYLNELSDQYPAINFTKISMYPPQSATIVNSDINAHIEMIVYGPR